MLKIFMIEGSTQRVTNHAFLENLTDSFLNILTEYDPFVIYKIDNSDLI